MDAFQAAIAGFAAEVEDTERRNEQLSGGVDFERRAVTIALGMGVTLLAMVYHAANRRTPDEEKEEGTPGDRLAEEEWGKPL